MKKNSLLKKKRMHFVGVGGIGMSGIARVLIGMGYSISGSDVESGPITAKLEELGGKIYRGHKGSNLPADTEVLVYSSSISGDNPEMRAARRIKTKIVHRAEVLGEIFNSKKGIAVTGTHGKTTTTSMIAVMLYNAGLDPTAIIGGEVDTLGGNARLGSGEYIVAEADESDSSFLHLDPFYTVMTNLEMEHIDHFKTLARAKTAFKKFAGNTKKSGAVFYNIDDANLREVVKDHKGKKRSFGSSEAADIYPRNIEMNGFDTSFECVYHGRALGTISIKVPGRHNVTNALACVLVGLEAGLKFKQIAAALKDFSGAKRRFELRADSGGVMLIEDYAHHPTEIRSVLAASRNWQDRRRIVIFQPHRYSRTKFFADDLGKCFDGADKLILTEIYAASERAIAGVSIKSVYDKVKRNGLEDVVVMEKELIPGYVMDIKRPGDMIIVMGAGNIKKVADKICEKLTASEVLDAGLVKRFENAVKGKVKVHEPLSSHTSFKIGGRAGIWFEPKDDKDLKTAVAFAKKNKVPFFVIGNGSNILAKDEGFKGILIHLGSDYFKKIKFSGNKITVGAGFSLPKLVNMCCDKALAGFESLVGIPGTVGGAVYMNAGGWTNPIFSNIGSMVGSLKIMDSSGKIKILPKDEIAFGYRRSGMGGNIILEAVLKTKPGDRGALMSSASHFLKIKREKQVLDMPSAGCVFKNPPDFQFTCGQMIDMLGLKGACVGGAEISPRHANFIVNKGGATCEDVLGLADMVKKKVKDNYDIDLEFEVKVV
ncbi:MAG: UDP-N-acetylmuramate--L-alanine ligase [Candidatus Omnitrophica bacterium]|nr:UDP-N-acetylmuramate--L-alanine ligase [Candidatus Omnitrophota bacterium]